MKLVCFLPRYTGIDILQFSMISSRNANEDTDKNG